MNSYRAELAGLHNMIQWMIEADNEACVKGLSTTFCGLSDLDKAEADLLVPCRNALKSFGQYEMIWTHGHQAPGRGYTIRGATIISTTECTV